MVSHVPDLTFAYYLLSRLGMSQPDAVKWMMTPNAELADLSPYEYASRPNSVQTVISLIAKVGIG